MSHHLNQPPFDGRILTNAAGVVQVPPSARLSVDAQAALAAAANGARPPAGAGGAPPNPQVTVVSAAEAEQQNHRMILAAQAQARAQALHAAQREDELLMRLLLQRNQQRREAAANLASMGVPGASSIGAAFPPHAAAAGIVSAPDHAAAVAQPSAAASIHHSTAPTMVASSPAALWGVVGPDPAAAARIQAQREIQIMDRNHALLLEEARARQGLRTLGYIHPQTGLTIPATSNPSSFAALSSQSPPLSSVARSGELPQAATSVELPLAALSGMASSSFAASAAAAPKAVAVTAIADRKEGASEDLYHEEGDEERFSQKAQCRKKTKRSKKSAKNVVPRQPFSAYGIFYSEEKDRIQQQERKARRHKKNGDDGQDVIDIDEESGEGKPEAAAASMGSGSNLAKTIANRWNALPEGAKKYYQDLSKEDHERQQQAMEDYHAKKTAKGDQETVSSAPFECDDEELEELSVGPPPPKKPASAFFLFSNGHHKELKRANPHASSVDISNLLSRMWKEAPREVRVHYMEEAHQLAQHYKVEILHWRKVVAAEKKAKRNRIKKLKDRKMAPFPRGIADDMDAGARVLENPPPPPPPMVAMPGHIRAASPSSVGKRATDHSSTLDEDNPNPKFEHDPNGSDAPKRPMSAFLAFSNKRRRSLKKQYPLATNADLSKMLSKTWREAPPVIREKYLKEAASLSEQYKDAVSKWKERGGQKQASEQEKQTSSQESKEKARKSPPAAPETEDENNADDEAVLSEDEEEEPANPCLSQEEPITNPKKTISSQICDLFKKFGWDASTLTMRVVDLCRIYDWSEVESATLECYDKCRKRDGNTLEFVINRCEALDIIRSKIPMAHVDSLKEDAVTDFVEALESFFSSTSGAGDSKEEGKDELHLIDGIDVALRTVLEVAQDAHYHRIEDWATEAPVNLLGSLMKIFKSVEAADPPVECRDEASKVRCFETVKARYEIIKLEELQKQRDKLVETTRWGEPIFSWSMVSAETDCPNLTAFLRSEKRGPETLIVGGGIDAAELVNKVHVAHFYPNGQRKEPRDMALVGFSVKIEIANNSGKHPAVTVTKTKDFFAGQVQVYRDNMVKLRGVCVEQRRLGVQAALLGLAKAPPLSSEDIDDDGTIRKPLEDSRERSKQEEDREVEDDESKLKKRSSALAAMGGRFKRRRSATEDSDNSG